MHPFPANGNASFPTLSSSLTFISVGSEKKLQKEAWEIFKFTSILIYCYPFHCCFYSLLFVIAASICRVCLWRCESGSNGPSFSCCAPQLKYKYIGLQQQKNFPKNENSCTRCIWWKMPWSYQIGKRKKDFEKGNENKEGKRNSCI